MAPLIPIVLAVAALGAGLGYYEYKKKATGGAPGTPSASTAQAMADLADKVGAVMPRGEVAFKPDLAQGIVNALAARFYDWPDPNDRRVVELVTNTKGAPISIDISAMGWCLTMNSTQSILAMLTAATTSPGTVMLRACPPGMEAQYAAKGMGYGVILYVGTLDKSLAPPGAPPPTAVPDAPLGVDAMEKARVELAGYPSLLTAFLQLLQQGGDPDAMDAYVGTLLADGFTDAPALLHKRANDLRTQLNVAPAPMPQAGVPTFKPGVVDTPAPQLWTIDDFQSAFPNVKTFLDNSTPAHNMKNGQKIVLFYRSSSPPGYVAVPATVTSEDPNATIGYATLSVDTTLQGGPSAGSFVKLSTTNENDMTLDNDGTAAAFIQGKATPAPAPEPQPVPPSNANQVHVSNAPSGLNLRSSPSTSASVLLTMPPTATATLLGPPENGDGSQGPNGWAHLTYTDNAGPHTGYASTQYLAQ